MASPIEHLTAMTAANLGDGMGFGVAVVWTRKSDPETPLSRRGRFQELRADEEAGPTGEDYVRRAVIGLLLDADEGVSAPAAGDWLTITSEVTGASERWGVVNLSGADGGWFECYCERVEPRLHSKGSYVGRREGFGFGA